MAVGLKSKEVEGKGAGRNPGFSIGWAVLPIATGQKPIADLT
jgi:hypothetical protein